MTFNLHTRLSELGRGRERPDLVLRTRDAWLRATSVFTRIPRLGRLVFLPYLDLGPPLICG